MSGEPSPKPLPARPVRSFLLRQTKLTVVILVVSFVVDHAIHFASHEAGNVLHAFGQGLKTGSTQLQPLGLARIFFARLAESEYGWAPLAWRTPFNLTAARQRLRLAFPHLAYLPRSDEPLPPSRLLNDSAAARATQAEYDRWQQADARLEHLRFPLVKNPADRISRQRELDHAALRSLATLASKFVGLADAALHVGA